MRLCNDEGVPHQHDERQQPINERIDPLMYFTAEDFQNRDGEYASPAAAAQIVNTRLAGIMQAYSVLEKALDEIEDLAGIARDRFNDDAITWLTDIRRSATRALDVAQQLNPKEKTCQQKK